MLARWGGEEFMLVTRLDEPSHCEQLAARLLQAVNASQWRKVLRAPSILPANEKHTASATRTANQPSTMTISTAPIQADAFGSAGH